MSQRKPTRAAGPDDDTLLEEIRLGLPVGQREAMERSLANAAKPPMSGAYAGSRSDSPDHTAGVKLKSQEWVAVSKNQAAPREFAVQWEEVGLPPLVLDIQIREDGKPLCSSITIDGSEIDKGISTGLLRDIPVRRIVREAVASASEVVYRDADGEQRLRSPRWAERQAFVLEEPQRVSAPIASDELLAKVAEVYRANPAAPAKAVYAYVNKMFGASRATAGRYIAEARKRKLLGKAIERKAGEAS